MAVKRYLFSGKIYHQKKNAEKTGLSCARLRQKIMTEIFNDFCLANARMMPHMQPVVAEVN
jgi:hypothetical protein